MQLTKTIHEKIWKKGEDCDTIEKNKVLRNGDADAGIYYGARSGYD